MKVKAVIDRFEGDKAVIFVGDEQDQLVIPRNQLPSAAKEGDWLVADVEDDRVLSAELDEEETARARERIAEKLAKWRRGEHRKE